MKFKFFGYTKIKDCEFEVKGITVFVGKNKEMDIIQNSLADIILNTLIENNKTEKYNVRYITDSFDYQKYIEAYPASNNYKINSTNDILNKINDFIKKNFEIKFLKETGMSKNRISKGLEIFLYLKGILENVGNDLKNNIFILENIENNLHPELQVKYIEFLIMFQEKYNIRLIFNTYSPFILNAIQVIANEKEITKKCKFYYVFSNGNNNQIEVEENLEKSYHSMAKVFQTLENRLYNNGKE